MNSEGPNLLTVAVMGVSMCLFLGLFFHMPEPLVAGLQNQLNERKSRTFSSPESEHFAEDPFCKNMAQASDSSLTPSSERVGFLQMLRDIAQHLWPREAPDVHAR